jgi:hypothetical protein
VRREEEAAVGLLPRLPDQENRVDFGDRDKRVAERAACRHVRELIRRSGNVGPVLNSTRKRLVVVRDGHRGIMPPSVGRHPERWPNRAIGLLGPASLGRGDDPARVVEPHGATAVVPLNRFVEDVAQPAVILSGARHLSPRSKSRLKLCFDAILVGLAAR